MIGHQINGNWDYFAYDGLGSVRGLMDGGGALTYSASYDPYGELMSASSGTGGSNLGFTGEYTDSNGLVYLRARYMNPTSGTFLSKDPFEGYMHRVMSRNGYTYVEGNPVMYTDPTGNAIIDLWAAAFIEDNEFEFPHPDELLLSAIWKGDGRSWHDISDFNRPFNSPPNSRVWWRLRLNTRGNSPVILSDRNVGTTSLRYLTLNDNGTGTPATDIDSGLLNWYWITETATAARPNPARVRCV